MGTKRRPINRPPRIGFFTEAALAALRNMYELKQQCRCRPRNWKGEYWKHTPCRACDEWWAQHAILFEELHCQPWDFPCVQRPGVTSPYPRGSYADRNWKRNLGAQERYQMLAEAAGIAL